MIFQQTNLLQSLMTLKGKRVHHFAEKLGCSMGRASMVIRGISPCSEEEVLLIAELLDTLPRLLPVKEKEEIKKGDTYAETTLERRQKQRTRKLKSNNNSNN